jgi:HD-GYP domain-containing protein (c-di-GMP phosphodiesterase class II)
LNRYYIKIKAGEIKVGEPLVWDVYDDAGVLLLQTGYIIETRTQLDILMSRGIFHASARIPDESLIRKSDLLEEVSPFQLIDQIYPRLEKLLCSSAPETEKDFPAKMMGLCRLLQQACARDADATLSTILLGTAGRYSLKHALDVAIICELTGQALAIPVPERLCLIAAALTENIAMTSLADVLCEQDAPLQEEQRKEIHRHPPQGVEILRSFGVDDPLWIDAVLKHHESPDGKGYPDGLQGAAVPVSARLIAIADFYCAKVTGRRYRPPLSSHKAMQVVFPAGDSRIDKSLVELFVKTLGIYLPGTFLFLKNNQIAVVTHRGESIHFPGVYAITGKDGMPLIGPMRRDTSNPDYKIVRIIPPREVAIKVNRYQLWGYGSFKNQEILL